MLLRDPQELNIVKTIVDIRNAKLHFKIGRILYLLYKIDLIIYNHKNIFFFHTIFKYQDLIVPLDDCSKKTIDYKHELKNYL